MEGGQEAGGRAHSEQEAWEKGGTERWAEGVEMGRRSAGGNAERRRMMGTRKKRQDDVVVAHGDDESVPSRAIARDV